MEKFDLIKESREWAADVWDESNTPEDERMRRSTLDLVKASASMGYSDGFKKACSLITAAIEAKGQETIYSREVLAIIEDLKK